ncbi:demethoxyubiquinone hydroxylase family protein [Sphingomonas sp. UYAg733]
MRADHTGEYGALRIYRAQIAIARRIAPDPLAEGDRLGEAISVWDKETSGAPSLIRVRSMCHISLSPGVAQSRQSLD